MWVYPEIQTVSDYPRYNARIHPDKPALIHQGRVTSWAGFDCATNQIAHALIALGIKPQDRVLYLGKSSDDFFIAFFGTAKARACIVPLNWRLSAVELAIVVADAEASFAFVDAEFAAMWREINAGQKSPIPSCEVGVPPGARDSFRHLAGEHPDTDPQLPRCLDDPVLQLYTSGTTGTAKGVVMANSCLNHMRLCEHFEPALTWRDDDLYLFCTPNFHLVGIGLSLQLLYSGVTLLIERQFDPARVLKAIKDSRPTILVVVPAIIQILLDHPDADATDFSSIRLVMYAGSPISLGLIKRALQKMPCEFMQFYGATETSGAVTLLRPDQHDLSNEEHLKSCGTPLALITLRIVDEQGQDTPTGVPGELLVRSPALAVGYWRMPEATKAVLRDGWYRTGDIAYRDEKGLYYIYDRAKDMIVSGGENVYSAEVESVLSTHPAVRAVAVIGVPDPKWGEAVKACIILKPEQRVVEKELLDFARTRLAGYKVPKSIDFMDAFPLTGSGKISKKDLRAPYWAGQARSVG